MKVEQWGGRRRWLAGIAGALVMLGGLVTLVRVPAEPPVRPPTPTKPAIQLGRTGQGDALLTDQATMYDQMPLFLPTERNVSARPPVLLVHGTQDVHVPGEESAAACRVLRGWGVAAELRMLDGLGHAMDDRAIDLGVGFLRDPAKAAS